MCLKETMRKKEYQIIPLAIIIICVFFTKMLKFADTDMYWIISCGRETIKNGFLYTNVFSVTDGNIVLQQWLHCVTLSLIYDNAGMIGLYVFNIVQSILLISLMACLINKKLGNILYSWGISCVLTCALYPYSNVRPQTLTLILLLIQCLIVEKYRETNNVKLLFVLPILTLIHVNVHASMWLMHLIVLLPYITPFPIKKAGIRNENIKIKPIIVPLVLMIVTPFLNPYGIKNVLYVIFSYGKELDSIGVSEMEWSKIFSLVTVVVLISLGMLVYTIYKKKCDSVSLYMIAGLLLLCIREGRNIMFFCMVFAYTIRLCATKENIDGFFKIGITKIPLYIATGASIFICVVSYIFLSSSYFNIDYFENDSGLPVQEVSYIRENAKEKASVFAINIEASYVEFYGYKTYLDMRPEIYLKALAGKDYLTEYVYKSIKTKKYATLEETEDFIKKYDFDYFIIRKQYIHANIALIDAYLRENPSYKIVSDNDKFILFEKKN